MKTKTLIIKLVFIALVVLILHSCADSNAKSTNPVMHADYTTYSEYSGKTISTIYYYKDRNPYTMQIRFTDGSILYIYANKYVLDVQKIVIK